LNQRAVLLALLSAALFGVSTPATKLLLGTTDPAILAGLRRGGSMRTSTSGIVDVVECELGRPFICWSPITVDGLRCRVRP
jgi:hypothetical protein